MCRYWTTFHVTGSWSNSFSPQHLLEYPLTTEMSKSKNHTNHNQIKKAHRNGIKKPKTFKYPSLKGVDSKFRRNHRHALHGTARALKEARENKA